MLQQKQDIDWQKGAEIARQSNRPCQKGAAKAASAKCDKETVVSYLPEEEGVCIGDARETGAGAQSNRADSLHPVHLSPEKKGQKVLSTSI